MNNRKGFAQDIIFFGIIAFIVGLIIVFGGQINQEFNTAYQASNASTYAKDLQQTVSDRYYGIFDYMYLTVLVLFMLAIFISVFMLDTHPAFFFVATIILGISLVVLTMLGNILDSFGNTTIGASQLASMPIVNAIMDGWVYIFLAIGFIVLVLLFSRSR